MEKQWRDLCVSHGGKLRVYYDYLAQTPTEPLGERIFEMKGPLAGTWECEVGGGARLQYRVDEVKKRVVIRRAFVGHPQGEALRGRVATSVVAARL